MPTNPYETPSLAARIRQWTLVGLLIVAAVLAKPGYDRFKVWRSRRLAQQAEVLARNHRFPEALALVQSAIQLAPSDRGSLRTIATTLSLASRPEALRFWQALVSSPGALPEDRVELVLAALFGGRLDIARLHIDIALKELPSNGRVLRAAALYCQLSGDHLRAAQFARASLAQDPQSEEMHFFLARELVRTEQGRSEGKNLLFEIAEQNGKFASDATQVLVNLPGMAETDLRRCLAFLDARKGSGVEEAFVQANLRIRLDPTRQAQVVSNMIERYGEAKGEEFLALVRWLSRERRLSELISLMSSREGIFTDQDLMLIYLDALAGLQKWAEVGAVLDREKLPLKPSIAELFRGRVARELGDNQAAESHWDKVFALCNDDPNILAYVGEYAEKSADRIRAKQAYKRLIQQPSRARPAYEALIRLAEQEGDTGALERLLQDMSELYPEDPAVKNDLAYIHLLENQKVPESLEISRKLLGESPSSVAARTAVALGLLRIGDPKGAKAMFNEAPFAWDTALPGWQAVYVAILGNLGQAHTAEALAGLIPFGRLKPEERALIAPWLKKQKGSAALDP